LSPLYTIRHPQIALELGIAELRSLHIHEEIIPGAKEALKRKILDDAVFLDPIIVDKESRVVLDGMHRVAASKEIGFRYIPVCYVDYGNPNLFLRSWYRTFCAPVTVEKAEQVLEGLKLRCSRCAPEEGHLRVQSRKAIAALCWDSEALVVDGSTDNIEDMYSRIRDMEEVLRVFVMGYATEQDARENTHRGVYSGYLETPCVGKDEVVRVALADRVFPQKTTRHVIPARPMGVRVRLDWLYGDSGEDELNERLNDHLAGTSIKEMPAGTILDRRYEEPLYVFQW